MRTTLVLVTTLVASFALAQDTVQLKRVAKEGDTAKYGLKLAAQLNGQDINFAATVMDKVTKVHEDGSITVSSEQKDATLEYGGQTTQVPPGVGAETTTTFAADGHIMTIETDTPDDSIYRMGNIQTFLWPKDPVGVGNKWESDIKGAKGKSEIDVHCTYEVTAKETVGKHDCFKVAFESKELSGDEPASSKGTVWIDIKSGLMVKMDTQWTNAPISGFVISGKASMSLIED